MAIQSRQPSMPGTCIPGQSCATGNPRCPCHTMGGFYDPDDDGDRTDIPGTPDADH